MSPAWESHRKASALAGAAHAGKGPARLAGAVRARPAVKKPGRNYTMSFFLPLPRSRRRSQPGSARSRAWAPGGGGRDAPELRREGSRRPRVARLGCSPACRPRRTQPRRMPLTRSTRRDSWVQVKARGEREGSGRGTPARCDPHTRTGLGAATRSPPARFNPFSFPV